MDPLSTVITTTGALLGQLEQLRARMNPQAELLALMNSITDLQATLIVVRDCEEATRNSQVPAAEANVPSVSERIAKVQSALNELVDFTHKNLLRNGKGLPRLGLSEKKRKRLREMQESVMESRHNLQLVLTSASWRKMSTIHEAIIIQNCHHPRTPGTLEQLVSRVTDTRGEDSEQPESDDPPAVWEVATSSTVTNTPPVAVLPSRPSNSLASSYIQITTTTSSQSCGWTCNCQCHIRSAFRTPHWLSGVVGTLFYFSTCTPSLNIRPCNRRTCVRSRPSSSSRFTYYFPTWMMRAAIVYSGWNNLDGSNSSWFVTMPRMISDKSMCWEYIDYGATTRVQHLLCTREMSPYDIDSEGESVLTYAIRRRSLDLAGVLVATGADWHIKDRFGISAANMAWEYIITEEISSNHATQLRELVGSEVPEGLSPSPLHRISMGLSSADIQSQLELDPTNIDAKDSIGRTPMMWAAIRGNAIAVRALLDWNADVTLRDAHEYSALHHAAAKGSLECVITLLKAGANANAVTVSGYTALHHLGFVFSASEDETASTIAILKDYGADLEALDFFGQTPLYVAVRARNPVAVKAFIESGANLDVIDSNGHPPICHGIYVNNPEVLQHLCSSRTNPSWPGPSGRDRPITILHIAAIVGSTETMEILTNWDIPPVECDPEELLFLYETEREEFDLSGRPLSSDEALAAFKRLIDSKGEPWTVQQEDSEATESIVSSDDSIELDDESEEDFHDAAEDLASEIENPETDAHHGVGK